MRTDRPELIGLGAASWVGHVLGTVGCYAEGFSLRYKNSIQLETIEWLCRCGITLYIEKLQEEIEIIKSSINADGVCDANIDEGQLQGFSTYSGQQLEVDWKSKIRKACDITFRALLILHYSKI